MSIAVHSYPVARPADEVVGPPQGQWTYAAYAALPDDGHHYEVIAGVLYVTPSPIPDHQDVVGEIVYALIGHIKRRGLGRVFDSPLDVELMPGDPTTTVRPDVVVVLAEHADRIGAKHIVGAPDLVVEVLSPSTATFDRRGKYDAYEAAGVDEYWLVDPVARTVEVLVLTEGRYQSRGVFFGPAQLPSLVAAGLPTTVEAFFQGLAERA